MKKAFSAILVLLCSVPSHGAEPDCSILASLVEEADSLVQENFPPQKPLSRGKAFSYWKDRAGSAPDGAFPWKGSDLPVLIGKYYVGKKRLAGSDWAERIPSSISPDHSKMLESYYANKPSILVTQEADLKTFSRAVTLATERYGSVAKFLDALGISLELTPEKRQKQLPKEGGLT